MELKKLEIENFRNFEKINIDLKNQNVVFGMNDVGKTNLIYALRFLLDREIRNKGFMKTDFFRNDTTKTIKITLSVSLEHFDTNVETQHIIAKVAGARNSANLTDFYFQLQGQYNNSEYFNESKLYWGNDIEKLQEIPQRGIWNEIDKLFEVVYVDPTIDLQKTFLKHKKKLFDQIKLSDNDKEIENRLKQLSDELNSNISSMDLVTTFQKEITSEYKLLKDDKVTIELKSEMAINGYFNDLIPYIKREDDTELYPTSGDGRKKLLSYSLLNYIMKISTGNKIIIYLIEEPENSLHRSMQIAFSKQLFSNKIYNYFFLTTHSSELLYEMDNASLIRIYSENKTNSSSYIYIIDDKYKEVKRKLNRSLAAALFADTVLLVEGPSEKILFEKVLTTVKPDFEVYGGYILEVDGIDFKPYVDTLKGLKIETIVKTDNDLQLLRNGAYNLLGINRCLKLIGKPNIDNITIDFPVLSDGEKISNEVKSEILKHNKLMIFKKEKDLLASFNTEKIFLSEIDLEHDLYQAIKTRMHETFPAKDPIAFLQDKKLVNMITLIDALTDEDCNAIFNHSLFFALKELTENNV
ncbi:AAA family ATPase [Paenibacillus sp. PsM32]|uniref:ATP-dependent nuclease n=1 Tax=Paenibacillus sp. PsM32 TaxID=3030536 RepID=UPI00263BA3F3|nr:AAA family ATPase [Paenibacillus sp. PsM32]MDN4617854.1 AAA family ATPase [Paenibacillus sp. PsM32]